MTKIVNKADNGKPKLNLLRGMLKPTLYAVARVREYGVTKYRNPENWRTVETERYRAALLRHMAAYIDDEKSVDEESTLPHLWHIACNVFFLIALSADKKNASAGWNYKVGVYECPVCSFLTETPGNECPRCRIYIGEDWKA